MSVSLCWIVAIILWGAINCFLTTKIYPWRKRYLGSPLQLNNNYTFISSHTFTYSTILSPTVPMAISSSTWTSVLGSPDLMHPQQPDAKGEKSTTDISAMISLAHIPMTVALGRKPTADDPHTSTGENSRSLPSAGSKSGVHAPKHPLTQTQYDTPVLSLEWEWVLYLSSFSYPGRKGKWQHKAETLGNHSN